MDEPQQKAEETEGEERQSETEAGHEPIAEAVTVAEVLVFVGARTADGRFVIDTDLRLRFDKNRTGVLDDTKRFGQLLGQIFRRPILRGNGFEIVQAVGEGLLDVFQNLEAFEGLVGLALDVHEGGGEFIHHLRAAGVELFLAAAELLELLFFALELFRLALEGDEALLGLGHLFVELFDAVGGWGFVQVEKVFAG